MPLKLMPRVPICREKETTKTRTLKRFELKNQGILSLLSVLSIPGEN